MSLGPLLSLGALLSLEALLIPRQLGLVRRTRAGRAQEQCVVGVRARRDDRRARARCRPADTAGRRRDHPDYDHHPRPWSSSPDRLQSASHSSTSWLSRRFSASGGPSAISHGSRPDLDRPIGRLRTALERSAREQLTQHELEDPAVAEIALLLRRVDPGDHGEFRLVGSDRQLARDRVGVCEPSD